MTIMRLTTDTTAPQEAAAMRAARDGLVAAVRATCGGFGAATLSRIAARRGPGRLTP